MSAFNEEAIRTLEHVEDMVKRLKANGGEIKSDIFTFKSCGEKNAGIGVFAKEDRPLVKGELLMQVPFSECLSVERVIAYPPLAHVFKEQAGLIDYPDEILAIGIMYAMSNQDVSCGWLDYLKACPVAEEMNTTIYWNDDEVEELKGCTVYHLTKMMLKQIDNDWETIHAQFKEVYCDILGNITKDLYKWSLSMIYSRAVGMPRHGKYERVLVPVLDMANMLTSSDAGETFRYNDENDTVSLINARNVAAGNQVFSTVGQYCNAKLAYTYGYVLHKQENQAVDLWTNISPSSANAQLKHKLLQQQPYTAQQNYDFTGTLKPNWISGALLSTIRVMQASPEELHGLQMGRPFIYNIITPENEGKTYIALRELLINRLNVEKVEEERGRLGNLLLDGVPHSNRLVMALMIQVEEREVIQSCIAYLDKCMVSLNELGKDYIPPDARDKQPSVVVAKEEVSLD